VVDYSQGRLIAVGSDAVQVFSFQQANWPRGLEGKMPYFVARPEEVAYEKSATQAHSASGLLHCLEFADWVGRSVGAGPSQHAATESGA
jgi:hypothetical protein